MGKLDWMLSDSAVTPSSALAPIAVRIEIVSRFSKCPGRGVVEYPPRHVSLRRESQEWSMNNEQRAKIDSWRVMWRKDESQTFGTRRFTEPISKMEAPLGSDSSHPAIDRGMKP